MKTNYDHFYSGASIIIIMTHATNKTLYNKLIPHYLGDEIMQTYTILTSDPLNNQNKLLTTTTINYKQYHSS